MKRLLIFFFVIACNSSTESKIINAISDIEHKALSANSTVESIAIDSVDYFICSKKDYWLYYTALYYQGEAAGIRSMNDDLASSSQNNDTAKFNAIIKNMRADGIEQDATHKELERLALLADTSKILYKVKYHLNAKTNKYNHNSNRIKFLKISDLTEFKEQYQKDDNK